VLALGLRLALGLEFGLIKIACQCLQKHWHVILTLKYQTIIWWHFFIFDAKFNLI
jgi:hypothetical protein